VTTSSGRTLRSGNPALSDKFRWLGAVVSVAAIALFAGGCGSGSGDASSSSRPSLPPIASERPIRPESTDAVVGGPVTPTVPDVTAPPATAGPDPVVTVPEPVDEDASTDWWVWGLIAVALVVIVSGVVALVRRSPKPAAAPARPQASTAAALLDQCDDISTHIAALAPDRVHSVAAADAARLAALHAAVEHVMASVADAGSMQALATLDASIRSLHAALDAIALSSPASLTDADWADLRARASDLHVQTSLARATLFPPPAAAR